MSINTHLPDEFGVTKKDLEDLVQVQRFTQTHLEILGKKMEITDSLGQSILYNEIFTDQVYKFDTSSETPYIIDCGANIGMSVLYFKWLYPNSEIIAIEPDPEIFLVLQRNIETYNLQNVELVPYAAWNKRTLLRFEQDGGVGGRIRNKNENARTITVKSIRLRDLINREIDLLKIDIEGAEFLVLEDCKHSLKLVKNIFVEYHSKRVEPQKLHQILKFLEKSGFRYYIKEAAINKQPFVSKWIRNNYFDLQLNIFGYRV